MKKLIIGMLVIGFTSQMFSQVIQLPDVEIKVVNYKYLNAVDSEDVDLEIKRLEKEVAYFDYVNSDFYMDDWVSFYIPKGKILASYDENGEIVTTTEKFENIKLPAIVRTAIFERFPGWVLSKNVYRVTYNRNKNKKEYKVVLQNGNKSVRVRTDEKGNFVGESHLK